MLLAWKIKNLARKILRVYNKLDYTLANELDITDFQFPERYTEKPVLVFLHQKPAFIYRDLSWKVWVAYYPLYPSLNCTPFTESLDGVFRGILLDMPAFNMPASVQKTIMQLIYDNKDEYLTQMDSHLKKSDTYINSKFGGQS